MSGQERGLPGLSRQFLAWVAVRPRSYAETMEAWRTSCPRLSVWEDALGEGLVALDALPGRPQGETRVRLTARGEAQLAASMATAG